MTRPQTELQASETELGFPLSFGPIQYADPTRGTVCLDDGTVRRFGLITKLQLPVCQCLSQQPASQKTGQSL